MVVDDEQDITFTIKQVLEDRYEIVVANEPEKALSDFRSGTYDLVVLDISMPKMNGFDFFRELRKKDVNVRALIITAMEMANYAPYASFREEFPDFDDSQLLKKPFSISELTEQIERVIGKTG